MQQTDCMGRRPADGTLLTPRAQSGGRSPVLDIGRRDFITLLGGAALAWPPAARAPQAAIPLVGVLGAQTPELFAGPLRALPQGLIQSGYLEHPHVTVDYRLAHSQ